MPLEGEFVVTNGQLHILTDSLRAPDTEPKRAKCLERMDVVGEHREERTEEDGEDEVMRSRRT